MPSLKEQEEIDRDCTSFGHYKDKAKCLTCLVEEDCIEATKDLQKVEIAENKKPDGHVTIDGMSFKWE